MKVLVFAKQIPDVNQISFDPETKRIVRENVPLLINSFDKKAVEEAIRLKENHGCETFVATMGPPQSKEILNDSLRMGIDKAFLVTDRVFGGSDTLVTSRILANVVDLVKPDIVLMGKYSLDGETSQVPPEVAVLSGYNFKSSISKIQIEEDSESCIVQHENESGLADYRVKFPAVFSVSEKINRARAIKEDVPPMYERIQTLNAERLGLDIVGSRDSPTVVTGTESIESGRSVEYLDYDDNLFDRILRIINREASEENEMEQVALDDFEESRKSIWGIALDDAEVSLEIASKISNLAEENGLNAVMVGNIRADLIKGMLCHKYYYLNAGESDVLAAEIAELIKKLNPKHVIFPSTVKGREVSAMIAAKLGLGLTADCIDVTIKGEELIQYKPAFGGGIVASITSKTSPRMATARPGMFKLVKGKKEFAVEEFAVTARSSIEKLNFEPVSSDFKPLGYSDTVIGAGRGLKSRNNLAPVMELASRLSASVGGTRPIVDMRWMPRQQQIGLTGVSISPKTYISLGVSGQDNHVVGIRYAGKIIAINTDSKAPIFRYADFGIIADANEFVSRFNDYLAKQQNA
ncbi:hypothetical protein IX51_04195 [uncultured archaeon]|nr:hypothetical protein IX51_04195 [uncultured archaeon]